MTIPSFEERVQQWSSPPVDDIGYMSSERLMSWNDEALLDLIRQMEKNRYGGWRNTQNRWRDVFSLDTTRGKRVLDYGCGVGLEAVQYIKAGNEVALADISEANLYLAHRVCCLYGFNPTVLVLSDDPCDFHPFAGRPYDVIHCVGVLHHIPEPIPVVKAMSDALAPGGELRLMVYSDEAWRIATSTDPPNSRVEDDPMFERYWQRWDPHGGYADWYDAERLAERFGEWFFLDRYEPLTEHGEYVGAVLVKR